MSNRGRKRVPTQLLKKRGTFRDDRHGKSLVFDRRKPKPTQVIAKNDLAKETFEYIATRLDNYGVLSILDKYALEALSEAYAEYRKHQNYIIENGETYTTTTQSGDEMIRPRPEVKMRNDAFNRMLKLFTEFGLTPSSRAKIQIDKKDNTDDIEDLLD